MAGTLAAEGAPSSARRRRVRPFATNPPRTSRPWPLGGDFAHSPQHATDGTSGGDGPMRILIALLAAALLLAPAFAGSKARREPPPLAFTKSEQILKWINDYRQAPEPDRLPDVVRAM